MIRTAILYALLAVAAHGVLSAQSKGWRWAAGGGGNGVDIARSVAALPNGGAVVVGTFNGSAAFGDRSVTSAGRTDIFVARYSPSGACEWARRVGGAEHDIASAITVDAQGNVYVAGTVEGAATISHESGFDMPVQIGGDRNLFVACFSSDGRFLWSTTDDGEGDADAGGLAVDGSGGLYVAGTFDHAVALGNESLTATGGRDIYLAKLSASSGAASWMRRGGGGGTDRVGGVAVDGGGNIYLGGSFVGSITWGENVLHANGSAGIFVARFDASGASRWVNGAIGDGLSNVAITADNAGNVHAVGGFRNTMTFGARTLVSEGEIDGFVASYDNSGVLRWVTQISGPVMDYAVAVASDKTGLAYVTGISQTLGKGSFFINVYGSDGVRRASYSDDGAAISHSATSYGIATDGNGSAVVCGSYSGRITFGPAVLNATPAPDGSEVSDIFVAKLGSAAGVAGEEGAAAARLLGIAPNPCSERATVLLRLGDAASMRAVLTDLRGNVVRAVERGAMGRGDHAIVIETGDLPQGPYLLEMRAGSWRDVRRIDVIR